MEKSNKAILLIHEIYGVNDHMKWMKEKLSKLEADIICPNLLSKDAPYSYEEEGMAYQNFVQNIGIDEGSRQITNMLIQLKQEYEEVGVIGFSVGAAISWLCSESNLCNFVIGCYGSRIRDYVNRSPVCPTLLIFPAVEQTFDVDCLINSLKQKREPLLEIKKFYGVHGFMNPFSQTFNKESADQAFQTISDFLEKQLADH
ncbi:dienelactone hydrolase family protein [Priestia megaterium]|uniref:dienelactone hydrolase family protein n=1 Tax=Priestia megaterium TaxID=1404 RepID=UPI00234F6E1B|nr:dienelactone hydrolase family protein [Priestia megaterium]MDC7721050.1 dienelactone hydrolase family protein [Priestia megaterium]MED4051467.1 dienelactone hydrolase family protein [Priestia megaterium]MED4062349.1 dienelactone hydrolase family protein [Priestia megaterium]